MQKAPHFNWFRKPPSVGARSSHGVGPMARALASLLFGVLTAPALVQASSPTEKVVCTQAPPNTWLSEAQARQAFGADRYLLVRFKVSRGQCHEFYAIEPDGTVVEAYQHPVTGSMVRLTRIAPRLSQP